MGSSEAPAAGAGGDEGRRRTGRPPITSRAALLAAGWQVGIDRLTIGQVTAVVGVRYSTFYRYFSDRDALLDAMVDDAFAASRAEAEHARDADEPARLHTASAALEHTSRHLNAVLEHHPGLAAVLVARPWPAAPITAIRETLLAQLAAAGTPQHPAAAAADLLISSIVFAHLTRDPPDPDTDDAELTHAQLVLITIAISRHL